MMRVDDRSGSAEVTTPTELAKEMIAKIPEHILKSSATTFLDPSFGNGTYLFELIKKLRSYNHTIENIQNRIYGCEISNRLFNKVRKKLAKYNFVNIIQGDSLEKDWNMKFDVVIGNPPYNLRSDSGHGKTGVAGDTKYWRKFVKLGFNLSKDCVVMVVPNNLKQLIAQTNYQINEVSFMTEVNYWKYRTLFFVGSKEIKTTEPVIIDPILKKLYTTDVTEKRVVVKTEDTLDVEGVEAICYITKGDFMKKSLAKTDKVVEGPKLMYSTLINRNLIVVTEELAAPRYARVIKCNTLEEAEKLKLFMTNNPIFNWVEKKMNAKNCFDNVFLDFKTFDLSQIETGYEMPVEWDLTEEEISAIGTLI